VTSHETQAFRFSAPQLEMKRPAIDALRREAETLLEGKGLENEALG
jgi:hypothetical protein